MVVETAFAPPEYQDKLMATTSRDVAFQAEQSEAIDHDATSLEAQRQDRVAEQNKNSQRRKNTFRASIRGTRPHYDQMRRRHDQNWGLAETSKKTIREKQTDRQAIDRDLRDSGIKSVDDWEQANAEYGHVKIDGKKVAEILKLLGETEKIDGAKIDRLLDVQENGKNKQKLQLLLSTNLSERLAFFEQAGLDQGQAYLAKRIDFYLALVRSKAVKITMVPTWDSNAKRYVDQKEEEPIIFDGNMKNIRLGLLRDTLYAAMIGTPELASHKIASRQIEKRDGHKTADFPTLRGFHSGVFAESIGEWETLITEYQHLAKGTAKKYPEIDPEVLEHLSVMRAARIFAKSSEYNLGRGIQSPYSSGFRESVAWAQLGEGVQAQLRGIRQKIQGVDLHNIGRFIGKSGNNHRSYFGEWKRLDSVIRQLSHGPDQAVETQSRTTEQYLAPEDLQIIDQFKQEAAKRATRWFGKEKEKIEKWWTKSQTKIADYEVSEEERSQISQNVAVRHEEKLTQLQQEYESEVARLNQRTPEQVLVDLRIRQETIAARFEKRKSLAAKAIDLHFAFNGSHYDSSTEYYELSSPYAGTIDWINEAPLGTLKRAHRQLIAGESQELIIKSACAEILFGQTHNNSVEATITSLLNSSDAYELQHLIKTKLELSKFGVNLSFTDLQAVASKNLKWIDQSLAVFSWEETRSFIDNNINLSLAPKIKKVLEEHNIPFDLDQLINVCKHSIINSYYYKDVEVVFSKALDSFTLEEVEKAMTNDVDLTILSRVSEFLTGHEIGHTFDQLVSICAKICTQRNDRDDGEVVINSYMLALQSFGFDTANEMLDKQIDFNHFVKIQSTLSLLNINLSFNKLIEFLAEVERVVQAKNRGHFDVDQETIAIREFIQTNSFSQLEDVYKKGILVTKFNEFVQTLTKKQASLEFGQIEVLVQHCSGAFYLEEAIDKFGLEQTFNWAQSGVNLDKVLQIKQQIRYNKKYTILDNMEIISHLAKNNIALEQFSLAMSNGFTMDELQRYPFLISSLQPKNSSTNSSE